MNLVLPRRLPLTISRMDVEEYGGNNPAKLAKAIHLQLRDQHDPKEPVPLEAITQALEIVQIDRHPLSNLEGALITTADRHSGHILVNSNCREERQRFTIAHELGHYLNLWHVQTADTGFECSRSRMQAGGFTDRPSLTRDARQEMEANRFAAELLLPEHIFDPVLDLEPDIQTINTIARNFACSFEATARRFCELSVYPVAIVFSKDGHNGYWVSSPAMPKLNLAKADRLPLAGLQSNTLSVGMSAYSEADTDGWLHHPIAGTLLIEHRKQSNGRANTLLRLVKDHAPGAGENYDEEDDDGGIEDTYDRLSRF